ncbi:hypothetical protein D9619_009634 [Psilocybe cf. subviscida]|uniref:Uncharacterized protein n=1 Tax=Psilocybe cf. subviscida TaxID=2480587 RepID=A0A8H5F6T6_9AGAR|nr:hypothetical protein D9619_009634 [Psilocybe cf. subviscida]
MRGAQLRDQRRRVECVDKRGQLDGTDMNYSHEPRQKSTAAANIERRGVHDRGLVGASPHMINAMVTVISRLVFELKATTLLVSVSSTNREIVKSILGFVKLAIHPLPAARSHESFQAQHKPKTCRTLRYASYYHRFSFIHCIDDRPRVLQESTGKMIIDDRDPDDEAAKNAAQPSRHPFREDLTSVDGFTRGANGKTKLNEDSKRRRREENATMDTGMSDVEPMTTKAKEKDESEFRHGFKSKVWFILVFLEVGIE